MTKNHMQNIVRVACLVCLMSLLASVASIIVTVALHNRENINGERIIEGESRLCERLNTVRHQDNNAHWVQWLQLKQTAARSRVLAVTERKNQKIRIQSAKQSEELAVRLTWTPLTNCYRAVYYPHIYRPPYPVPFNRKNLIYPPADR